MPYIEQTERDYYEVSLRKIIGTLDNLKNQPGHLNYVISRILEGFAYNKGVNYACLSETAAQARAAAAEFERRVLGPYEDQKIIENGDVYGRIQPI